MQNQLGFRDAVASGDPVDDGFVIWTRIDGADGDRTVALHWTVKSEDSGESVAHGVVDATPAANHTVRVDVRGLPAGRYRYRFATDDLESPVGRTRTLPDGARPVRIAFTSCANYRCGYFNAYGRIADRDDLDFVVHLGDYIYEYSDDKRSYPSGVVVESRRSMPRGELFELAEYRDRYFTARRDPDAAAMHAAHPVFHSWDDHEVVDDAWSTGCPDGDTVGVTFAQRRAAALRAFWEMMPVRWPGIGVVNEPPDTGQLSVSRSVRVGDLLQLVLIDTRHEGRDRLPEKMTAADYVDEDRKMMSADQWNWLFDTIKSSAVRWQVIGNQSMMAHSALVDPPMGIRESVRKVGRPLGDDRYGNPGQWEGFAPERSRLFRWLRANTDRDVVVLTGDIHSSWANELGTTTGKAPVAVEFVSPSVTSATPADPIRDQPDVLQAAYACIRDQLPWVRWTEWSHHGFVEALFDRDEVTATWWHVPTVTERSPDVEAVKSFTARRGELLLRER